SKDTLSPDMRDEVRRTTKRLVGLEVLEEDSKKIVLQCLVEPSLLNPERILRRLEMLSMPMQLDSVQAFVSSNGALAKGVVERDEEVDRWYFLLVRLVRAAISDTYLLEKIKVSSVDCLDFRLLASYIETFADYSVTIAENTQDGVTIPKEEQALLEKIGMSVNAMYRDAVGSVLSRDLKLASSDLDVGVGRLLSEEMRRAVGTILEAGFQMESEAFKTLVEKGREDSLKPLVDEVLKMASLAQPRPLFISADLVLRAAEQLDLAAGPVVPVEGLGHGRRFAEDRESRLEVVFDPTGKLGTTGALDDFLRYFRSRFEKMSALFRQRIDTRSAGTISDALAGGTNGRGRFVCMVVEKREKANRIFLTVDDYDDEATVLVGDSNPSVWQTARRISRDQVLFLETRKSSGKLLVAENIVLPEIPDHRPGRASDEVYAVLISDVH